MSRLGTAKTGRGSAGELNLCDQLVGDLSLQDTRRTGRDQNVLSWVLLTRRTR